MKKLTLQQVKKCELDILIALTNYCEKHNLRYYLAYGTLLGAVRHGGFIPWDDDIDICMPREDYERFKQLMKTESVRNDLDFINIENGKWNEPEGKIVNVNTIGYKRGDFETGLWVDIFPLDFYDKDILKKNIFWRRVHIAKCTEKFDFTVKGIIKLLLRVLFFWKSLNSISKGIINRTLSIKPNGYLSNMTWASDENDVMPIEWINGYSYVEFEGIKFKTYTDVDGYLKQIYGNYMKLPPIGQQKTHNVVAYWIGNQSCNF